jgi:uncharacterized SAM-binding protein YcdF (DUF218 family)
MATTTTRPAPTRGDDRLEVHRSRTRRWLRRGLLVVVAVVAIFGIWVCAVAAQVWWVGRSDDRTPVDVIVVMGASQYDGRPSPVLAWRLTHAKTLYQEGVAPQIITVGGKLPGDRFTEGQSGVQYLGSHGVPSSALIAVDTGRDTWRSMKAVDAVMKQHGWTSMVIVTDPWHSYRCRQMARSLGLTADTSPVHSGPIVQSRELEARYIARETAAYVWWRLSGGRPLPITGWNAD